MKKLFVFVPAIFIVPFLLHSFRVFKGEELNKNAVEHGESAAGLKLADRWSMNLSPKGSDLVYKSSDGGQTWQDISAGLPIDQQKDGVRDESFFANNSGIYFRVGNAIYHNEPTSKAPYWKKETSPDKPGSIAPAKAGMLAYSYEGQISRKANAVSSWSPIYTNFPGKIRSVFETAGGTVLIGSENGLFKSADGGKSWKQIPARGWVTQIVESDGVLLATSMWGIIRSTDDGESWTPVISEGGVGIDVERIQGGFAAITYSKESNSRRVRTSYDGGKTWQAIDAGLPADLSIASIIQVGGSFFCGHPAGVFKSSDKGKTWQLLLPAVDNKVFNLVASGQVIYAIPRSGGC